MTLTGILWRWDEHKKEIGHRKADLDEHLSDCCLIFSFVSQWYNFISQQYHCERRSRELYLGLMGVVWTTLTVCSFIASLTKPLSVIWHKHSCQFLTMTALVTLETLFMFNMRFLVFWNQVTHFGLPGCEKSPSFWSLSFSSVAGSIFVAARLIKKENRGTLL